MDFSGCSVYDELNRCVVALAEKRKLESMAFLTRDLHILPDFHGNRSPVADPTMKGMVSQELNVRDVTTW